MMNTKQLIRICNIMAVFSGLIYLAVLIVEYAQSKYVGKNYAIDSGFKLESMHELWVGMIFMVGLVSVCALFFAMSFYAKKGKLFTKENEQNLNLFGTFIILTAVVSAYMISIYSISTIAYYASGMLLMMGISLIYFSLLFKISRKLKEEQDLTV